MLRRSKPPFRIRIRESGAIAARQPLAEDRPDNDPGAYTAHVTWFSPYLKYMKPVLDSKSHTPKAIVDQAVPVVILAVELLLVGSWPEPE